MSLHLNGNTIGDLYVGGTKVGEAWLNGQKVYSSVHPVINYLFRDIDADGNLTQATGALEDANEITQIGNYGLYYAFYKCSGLTGSVSFPNLTSIGAYGLYHAFSGCKGLNGGVSFPALTSIGEAALSDAFDKCTGLTGSVSFPSLISVGSSGLAGAFYNCSGITEVHFKSSLSGNSQCTMSAMGCYNATVYFDL